MKRRPRQRKPQRRIRIYEAEPRRFLADPELCQHWFAEEYLRYVDAAIVENPQTSLHQAALAVLLGWKLQAPEIRIRAYGLVGTVYRLLGKFDQAEAVYARAFEIAPMETWILADLHQRRAILRSEQKRWQDAFTDVDLAIELEKQEGRSPARALFNRGVIFFSKGEYVASVADWSKALEGLSPEDDPTWHRAAVFNLTSALFHAGYEDAETTYKKLLRTGELFRGCRGVSQERARFRWLLGQVSYRIGRDAEAARHLEQSRKIFASSGMDDEVVAVSADLARVNVSSRSTRRSRRTSNEFIRVLLSTVPAVSKAASQAAAAVVAVVVADQHADSKHPDPERERRLVELIYELRATLEDRRGVLPCAIQ